MRGGYRGIERKVSHDLLRSNMHICSLPSYYFYTFYTLFALQSRVKSGRSSESESLGDTGVGRFVFSIGCLHFAFPFSRAAAAAFFSREICSSRPACSSVSRSFFSSASVLVP